MPDGRKFIILSLANEPDADTGGETTGHDSAAMGCGALGAGSGACGGTGACGTTHGSCSGPRVPVLACRDTLTAAGHPVELVTACSDKEIDAVIAQLDGAPRSDGLTWPAGVNDGPALIVAADSDAQLRAVVRRMVRRYAPPPSRRPADIVDGRTLPDLPAIGVLPLDPAGGPSSRIDLTNRLGLPRDPADVAKAASAGTIRRLDLFRTDAGSITLHGALLGGVDEQGQAAPWAGRVHIDDIVLSDGKEPVLACAVANANGYTHLDELALAPRAQADSGTITVAVAVPIVKRSRWGRTDVRIEVRRATGRAVSVAPQAEVPLLDDGVLSPLTRKRTWWIEPSAWAVFTT